MLVTMEGLQLVLFVVTACLVINEGICEDQVASEVPSLLFDTLMPDRSVCGAKKLTGTTFRLTSPGFPGNVPANIKCCYEVVASSPNVCGLDVTFLNFDLQCEGTSLLLPGQREPICGPLAGSRRFQVRPQQMSICLQNGPDAKSKGFDLRVTQIECPRDQPCKFNLRGSQVEISSPGWPRPFPAVTCEYLVEPLKPTGTCSFTVRFSQESNLSCDSASLRIGEDNLCGWSTVGERQYETLEPRWPTRLVFTALSPGEEGKGFRLLLTQIPCGQSVTSLGRPRGRGHFHWQFWPLPPHTPSNPGQVQSIRSCCPGEVYTGFQSRITSPEFPYSATLPYPLHCKFIVTKHSPRVCNLRIRFAVFSLPEADKDSGCSRGFLEVGGRQFCGCMTGREVNIPFLNDSEEIRLWWPEGSFTTDSYGLSGFAIEIFQEDVDRIRVRQGYLQNRTSYVQSRDFDNAVSPWNGLHYEIGGEMECTSLQLWHYWSSVASCRKELSDSSIGCLLVTQSSGIIQSPGYPNSYPSDASCCFCIPVGEGSCSVGIRMLDFDLGNSLNCEVDYFALGSKRGRKYCGQSLASASWKLTESSTLYFVSGHGRPNRGRGFKLQFQAISCCGGNITEEKFTISNQQDKECIWHVHSLNENSCEIRLYMEVLTLPCADGFFQAGSHTFCGERTGESVRIPVDNSGITLKYLNRSPSNGVVFRVRGEQFSCLNLTLDVPAQRFGNPNLISNKLLNISENL